MSRTAMPGCCYLSNSINVSDVTKSEIIFVKKAPGKGGIHSLEIYGTGKIDGQAVCCIIEIPGIAKWYSLKLQTEFPNYAMYFAA